MSSQVRATIGVRSSARVGVSCPQLWRAAISYGVARQPLLLSNLRNLSVPLCLPIVHHCRTRSVVVSGRSVDDDLLDDEDDNEAPYIDEELLLGVADAEEADEDDNEEDIEGDAAEDELVEEYPEIQKGRVKLGDDDDDDDDFLKDDIDAVDIPEEPIDLDPMLGTELSEDELVEEYPEIQKGRVKLGDDEDDDLPKDDIDAVDIPEEPIDLDPMLGTELQPLANFLAAEEEEEVAEVFDEDEEEEDEEEGEEIDEKLEEGEDLEPSLPPLLEREAGLGSLLLACGYEVAAQVVGNTVVQGLQNDVNLVRPGDLFFTASGTESNKLEAARKAFLQGAAAVVTDVGSDALLRALGRGRVVAHVDDVQEAEKRLAQHFYDKPSSRLQTFGIVGSAGKTTTAWLLRAALETDERTCGMVGTLEYAMGIVRLDIDGHVWTPSERDPTESRECSAPWVIIPYKGKYPQYPTTPDNLHLQKLLASMADRGADVAIVECSVDAIHDGSLDNIDFDVLVHTNVFEEQAEKSAVETEEAYVEEIVKLFSRLKEPQRQRAIINMDDPYAERLLEAVTANGIFTATYSMQEKAPAVDVFVLREPKVSTFETILNVSTPLGKMEMITTLQGPHNVYNILAATSAFLSVKLDLLTVLKGIESVESIPGRSELIDEGQPFAVYVDAANTPQSLERMCDALKAAGASTLWLVVGAEWTTTAKERMALGEVAHYKSDWAIITNHNPGPEVPRDIIDDIVGGFPAHLFRWRSITPYMQDPLHLPDASCYNSAWAYQSAIHKYFVEDRYSAIRVAIGMAQARDVVLVAGKGDQDFQEYDDDDGRLIKGWHDDRVECRNALSKLGYLYAIPDLDRTELPWTRYPEERADYPLREKDFDPLKYVVLRERQLKLPRRKSREDFFDTRVADYEEYDQLADDEELVAAEDDEGIVEALAK